MIDAVVICGVVGSSIAIVGCGGDDAAGDDDGSGSGSGSGWAREISARSSSAFRRPIAIAR